MCEHSLNNWHVVCATHCYFFLLPLQPAIWVVSLSVCVCICNVYCYLGQHQWHQSTYKNISKKIVSSSSSSFYFRCGISIFHCSIQIDMRAHNFFFCSLRFYLFYFFFSRITAERISWIHLLTRYFWFIGDFFPIFVCVFFGNIFINCISNSSRFVNVIYFDKISSCVEPAFRWVYIYSGHFNFFFLLFFTSASCALNKSCTWRFSFWCDVALLWRESSSTYGLLINIKILFIETQLRKREKSKKEPSLVQYCLAFGPYYSLKHEINLIAFKLHFEWKRSKGPSRYQLIII